MVWTGDRRADLPGNWPTIRARILGRDPICRLVDECCIQVSTEVDHIGDKRDHREHMLRGVCSPCHKRRTQQQARAARPSRRRPLENHPGRLG